MIGTIQKIARPSVLKLFKINRIITPQRILTPVRFYTEKADEAKPEQKSEEKPEDLQELLKKKDHEIAELKDLYRRALADAENVRIRTRKEIQDKEAYAIQKFAKDLLDTADVLTLALNAVPENERGENKLNPELGKLYTGVELTRKELWKVFQQYGITHYDPLGEKFDYNLHTALFQSVVEGKEPGTIIHVDKIGYKIKDRILRPANVGVVKEN
ncbi:GrpE protein, mitochondrial [Boothiomyces sp. JEL0866]|nr:GrpE protein, mitochondrial [Boothiomyces sp. JEL0866]KAJ3322349.1 GrpE protein, mitochondrial [Boothiomyces sp. JEL0866]